MTVSERLGIAAVVAAASMSAAAVGAAPPEIGAVLQGRCVAAMDGDSLAVEAGGARLWVDLAGIDAPEVGDEPWGPRARRYLQSMAAGETVVVRVVSALEDRVTAKVERRGTDLSLAMVDAGLARALDEGPGAGEQLRRAEAAMREIGWGMWGPGGS